MKNYTIIAHGGNQYSVTMGEETVTFNLDGFSFVSLGATDDCAFTKDEFICMDDKPAHAEALMDYLHIS